jgi:hypothetical protein
VAIAAINVALAGGLATLFARGPTKAIDPAVAAVLAAIGLTAGVYAVAGWRRYLRRQTGADLEDVHEDP